MSSRPIRGVGYLTALPDPKAKDALAWIADRYECATVLYDGSRFVRSRNGHVMVTPEHVAWEYLAELEVENGGGLLVPPCAGGPLADALIELREAIV